MTAHLIGTISYRHNADSSVQYTDKKAYNNLPTPERQHLAPFLVEDWDTVKAMDLNRENLETWHFSGIPVLVAFTPEQFPGTISSIP